MKKQSKPLFWLAFIIYIILLIKVTLIRVPLGDLKYAITHLSLAGVWDRFADGQYIPFKTIYHHYMHSTMHHMLTSFGWLMLWMIPMGFFLPHLTKVRRYVNVLIFGLLFGMSVELLQLILNVANFAVDDIIQSGLGVSVGYIIYKIFR